MRRFRIAVLAIVASVVAWSASVAAAPGWKLVPVARWVVSEADGRSIQITYRPNECGERALRAHVRETPGAVTIGLTHEVEIEQPGRARSCPGPKPAHLTIQLRAPLAGRSILGRSPEDLPQTHGIFGFHYGKRPVVPSLIGFSPADAQRALAFADLTGNIHRHPGTGKPRVTGQHPAARTVLSGGAVVQVNIGG